MSQLKITDAGIAYKDLVFAGTEVQNITKFIFANVPGLLATDPISASAVVPVANVVHSETVDRVSRLEDNAIVMSAVLGYDIGDFEFNWYGAIAEKADGSEVLIAVVHTALQTKTKTVGANVGNYSVKSILWRSNAIAATLNVTLSTLPWQVSGADFVSRADFAAHSHTAADVGALGFNSVKCEDLDALSPSFSGQGKWHNGTVGRPAQDQSNEYGTFMQWGYDSGWITQIAHDFRENNIYFRTTGASGDKAWRKMYHTGFKPTASDVGALPASGGTVSGVARFTAHYNDIIDDGDGAAVVIENGGGGGNNHAHAALLRLANFMPALDFEDLSGNQQHNPIRILNDGNTLKIGLRNDNTDEFDEWLAVNGGGVMFKGQKLATIKTYPNTASMTFIRHAMKTIVNQYGGSDVTFTLDESTFQVDDRFVVNRLFSTTGVITLITDEGVIYAPNGKNIGNEITMNGPAHTVILEKYNDTNWIMKVIPAGEE